MLILTKEVCTMIFSPIPTPNDPLSWLIRILLG